jgi:RNA polymerase sigma-70 factor, ECF subfamily
LSRREPAVRSEIQELLARLARGDRSAFDPLFERLWPLVRGFTARCLPLAEADDAAQEALLRVFFRASEFDPSRDALAWVLGIAGWEIRTVRTKSRRRREDAEKAGVDRADGSPSPEQAAMRENLVRALDAAISELPAEDASTLLAYARGERPDLPGPTFRKRVQRALARLRSHWRYDHGHF